MDFKLIAIFCMLICSGNAWCVDFAITIDDPNLYESPLMGAVDRDKAILNHLKTRNLKAALFVCGMRVDSSQGKLLLERWDRGSHLIANHSYTHFNYNDHGVTYEKYSTDILRGESIVSSLANFQKFFRFPFLKSGETVAKRDSIRGFLSENGYRHGYVTVDASDWYISQRMEKRLNDNPNADLSGYRDFYLKHIWERSVYYNSLAQRVLGRSPKHTILVHHNLLNALFLSDLIAYLESKGWKAKDAEEAFTDPIFALTPNTMPSGEGIVWALAKESGISGLRYPAEDGRYEEAEMDQLGL